MRRPARLYAVALAIAAAACRTPALEPAPPPPVLSVPSPPEWQTGDRWVYDWTSGSEHGTKALEITGRQEINAVQYYVARIGDADHYYTRDLHWAAVIRDSRVHARASPPLAWFSWPLEVGKRWAHQSTWEEQGARQTLQDRFVVVGVESIDVPAGRFDGWRVTREGLAGASDEYWYVAAVRSYVRWVGRRGGVQFEERLREYRPGGSSTFSPPAR